MVAFWDLGLQHINFGGGGEGHNPLQPLLFYATEIWRLSATTAQPRLSWLTKEQSPRDSEWQLLWVVYAYLWPWLPWWLSGKECACPCRRFLPMQETWVRSLGWEDPLEKEPQPTPVFLPGKSHAQGSLMSYSPWGGRVTHDWMTNNNLWPY